MTTAEGLPIPDVDDSDDEAPILVEVAVENGNKQSAEDAEPLPPCPVTILSGFLGSGKTTLIQNILKSPAHGKRIAVIENEFGDGLDVESLIARDGVNDNSSSLTDLIELPNGCICCTVKDTLVTTLEALLEKRKYLDHILIECSGMANPGPIASLFWLDDALESRLRLDGIVTLVDAKHIRQQLASTEEAAQQVAYADRILLNKTDLVARDDRDAGVAGLTATLQHMNPTAEIRPTQFALVPDLNWILDANMLDPERMPNIENVPVTDEEEESNHSHNHSHDHNHNGQDCAVCQSSNDHKHTDAVTTIALVEKGNVDLDRVDKWLATVLWPTQDDEVEKPNAPEIFRIKGVLAVEKDLKRHIVQAVHDLWEVYPATLEWEPEEERQCKMVVIGKFLPKEDLQRGFRSCFV